MGVLGVVDGRQLVERRPECLACQASLRPEHLTVDESPQVEIRHRHEMWTRGGDPADCDRRVPGAVGALAAGLGRGAGTDTMESTVQRRVGAAWLVKRGQLSGAGEGVGS